VGFDDIVNTQVAQVNGQKINNLVDLVHAVESDKGKYMQFDLEYNQMVILDKAEAIKATPEILLQHCIPADRSEDLILPVV
jgi:PDZ domain